VVAHRKLSDQQVLDLRELRKAGANQLDLAADFGISQSQVSKIVRGLRWQKAGGPIQRKRRYNRGR